MSSEKRQRQVVEQYNFNLVMIKNIELHSFKFTGCQDHHDRHWNSTQGHFLVRD